ncbi:hypothetical protein PLESTF_000117700 [Pleodorina starrii]|nr:hypothetical protein PLESTM_001283400 [Pleodorina starrii]GLC64097.1 hypothetical protein PLESTF_000117700 [Pleodorina starrii]
MSANLASPGVSIAYREIARYLRWSVMSIRGNIPIIGSAFNMTRAVQIPDGTTEVLGLGLQQLHTGSGATVENIRPPDDEAAPSSSGSQQQLGSRHRRGRAVLNSVMAAAAAEGLQPLPSSPLQSAPASSGAAPPPSSPMNIAPPPGPVVNNNRTAEVVGREVLIAWLRSVSALSSSTIISNVSDDSATTSSTPQVISSTGIDAISRPSGGVNSAYLLGGAAAGGGDLDTVALDSSGRILQDGWEDRSGQSTGLRGNGTAANDHTVKQLGLLFVTDRRDLLLTLITAGIIMGGLTLGHLILNMLYKQLVNPNLLHPALQFPRFEMGMAAYS